MARATIGVERIGVARQVFTALAAGRTSDEQADLAFESGYHGLLDAIDAHAETFEVAAFDAVEEDGDQ